MCCLGVWFFIFLYVVNKIAKTPKNILKHKNTLKIFNFNFDV